MALALTSKDYRTEVHNNWCPGCGDFGILAAIQRALAELQLPPHKVAVYSGIGCSGKTTHYINTYGFHTLHGRVLPVATGAKLANKELTVIAVGGDGDGYGIGAGYFVNAGRRNLDFTYLVFNNAVYGLTKGQAAPTMPKGLKAKSMSAPAIQDGINPIALAVASGYTFIARGYALDVRPLSDLIVQAVRHRGTSFIDILQTCPTYNDLWTKEWFEEQLNGHKRVYYLDETDYDPAVHDASDEAEIVAKKVQAVTKSYEWGERIPIGVLYEVDAPTYEEQLAERTPYLATTTLVEADLFHRDLTPLLDQLR